MQITQQDRDVLRSLAEQVAEIAALPVHKQTAAEWTRMNDLEPGRPLVWVDEVPWHEVDDDEMKLRCSDPFCRSAEWRLRHTLYMWNHIRGDMIVEPLFNSHAVINDTGFGIETEADMVVQDERGGIVSRGFHSQIMSEKDVEKIKDPVVTLDAEATEQNAQALDSIFGDILPVRKVGVYTTWFAPWDMLVEWWGVEQALTDIVMRPELVHAAMERLTGAWLARLEQWKKLNVLTWLPGNYRVGSGGPAYTTELPKEGFDPDHVRTQDLWGHATAQIFCSVSPGMHDEFAFQYERRWLENYGLAYYGCCEPLHNKLDMLESMPNIRKVSMSPWADLDVAVPKINGRYVLSHKPSPAVFATDDWNPQQARKNLSEAMEKMRGCPVEIIMKDISTVRGEARRLWEWAEIAADVADQFA